MSDAVSAARKSAGSPMDKLECGTRAFVGFLFDHSDWLRIHVRSRLSWAVRPQEETVAQLWQEGLDGYAEIVRDGIACGDFCDEDPVELAVLVQALTKVQVSQALESGEGDAERVADRLNEQIAAEARGVAFWDWVDREYDPVALRAGYKSSGWGNWLVNRLLRRE